MNIRSIFILFLSIFFTFSPTFLLSYRFAVYGDAGSPMGNPEHFNKKILGFINNYVVSANPKVDFVLFLGDQVNSATNKDYKDNYLQEWLDFMKSGLKGIRLFPAIGNHELYGSTGWIEKNLQGLYKETFKNLPQNGPKDYKQLNYYFNYGSGNESSLFVTLDSFGFPPEAPKGFDNDYDKEQLDWIKKVAQNSPARHKFLFMHAPLYSISNYPIGKKVPALIDLVKAYDFDLIFSGHEHIYARARLGTIRTTSSRELRQILPGPAGSAPTQLKENSIELQRAELVHTGYSFVIVDVQGNSVTETAYAVKEDSQGNLSVEKFDEFNFSKEVPSATPLPAQK